ncbi:MAG TPA: site-2 protease family protein, partial [Candidatus Saccharimonadales bacterium]|nr:site-2 protease family protein [Candidatus Saccharimonadales bacterium]
MLGDLATLNLLYIVISIVIGLSVHEAMHAFTAHWLGDTTAKEEGRVSLNPLRHIDPFTTILLPIITLIIFKIPILAAKPVPFNPERVRYEEFGSAMIAAAGPLTNLVLAITAAPLLSIVALGPFAEFLAIFIQLNVVLFIFNILPIPPLDGSRVLYAFAPEPLQRFMDQIEPYGLFIVFGLVLTGVLIP